MPKAVQLKDENSDKIFPNPHFPVGSIYMSVIDTNPSQYFGGEWEKIEGKFLLGASSSYPVNSTGGEVTHKLTTEEMPQHKHTIRDELYGGDANIGQRLDGGGSNNRTPQYAQTNSNSHIVADWEGGNKPHNNMPPYLAVYIWKRTK